MLRLGILGSTRGTLMLHLIEAIRNHQLLAEINIVLSNKPDALILENARKYALPALFVDPMAMSRADYDNKLTDVLQQQHVDLVVLVGYMRILSKKFVEHWAGKIINVHPSLLPAYAGLMDRAVHQAVLTAKETQSGCTVHYVTEQVDAGPIVIQKNCQVFDTDTVDQLKSRVQALEGIALVDAINKIAKKV